MTYNLLNGLEFGLWINAGLHLTGSTTVRRLPTPMTEIINVCNGKGIKIGWRYSKWNEHCHQLSLANPMVIYAYIFYVCVDGLLEAFADLGLVRP